MEVWKDIQGYEGLYQVNSLGEIKSLSHKTQNRQGVYYTNNKILKSTLNNKGYLTVKLTKQGKQKGFKIHRLVAIAFIKNELNLPQVNHKDENKENNKVDNLEWCTNKYNANYGTKAKRQGDKIKGKNNPMYGKSTFGNKGHKHSEETKRKIREKLYERISKNTSISVKAE